MLCGPYGVEEKFIVFMLGNLKERYHWVVLDVGGRFMLK